MTDLNPLFIRACEALWGKRWQTEAAEALCMSDRNIRYIVAGERPVKGGMLMDILRIMTERQSEMDEIIEDLRKWGSQQ